MNTRSKPGLVTPLTICSKCRSLQPRSSIMFAYCSIPKDGHFHVAFVTELCLLPVMYEQTSKSKHQLMRLPDLCLSGSPFGEAAAVKRIVLITSNGMDSGPYDMSAVLFGLSVWL